MKANHDQRWELGNGGNELTIRCAPFDGVAVMLDCRSFDNAVVDLILPLLVDGLDQLA